jgi:DMSO/TMAO reductase YedYZ heme-binding membrane subunit
MELVRYLKVSVFGFVLLAIAYAYTAWNNVPSVLNKSIADVSIILIGISMVQSSLCYFVPRLNFSLQYRKHLGLLGFAFAFVHLLLSWGAFERLFRVETWQQQSYWPVLTGFIALLIFAMMSLISNRLSATLLGGKLWKFLLRTGYIAMALVLAHVVLLKLMRWQTWYKEGMSSPPVMSLIVTIFIIFFFLVRITFFFARLRKKR